jgi:pyridoxamine 5'-phosphate oxidase
MNVDDLRARFMEEGLLRSALNPDPFKQFEQWFSAAIDSGRPEPTAMCLATVAPDGQPWQRMVLLKIFDRQGFVFFTNYSSRKAGQIADNPKVSLLFPWQALGRQVKVTGEAEKISAAESLKYFVTRPRGSQIGAWASPQSQVIKSRALLDAMVDDMKRKFADGHIPLPSHWGGYRVTPDSMEFWQARENRLHDRFLYRQVAAGEWWIERLAP